MLNRKSFYALLLLVFIGVSCQDDLDDVISPSSNIEIQNFVWEAMNVFYLYRSDVPDLSQRSSTDSDFDDFISSFDTPESLFDNLIREDDRFSVIVSDFRVLEAAIQGQTLSNGMRFGLVLIENTTQVFGYVRYVVPDSSADLQGVERGMIFTEIDGTPLSDTNFNELLSPEQYSIGLAELQDGQLITTGQTILLNKAVLTENPIHIANTLDINGQSIGYLMYNGFRSNFESELNQVFAQFVSDGVTDLVLDLRYNGGGSIETAKDLASMITGQFEGEIFAREKFNDNFEEEVLLFDDQTAEGENINNLNLNRVFVLTTGSTASASELVINALDPYITVTQIGTTTTGKFQGSTTLYDSPDFRRQNANPNHFYALQPLILEIENVEGFTGFTDGFDPEIELAEDFFNLGELGNPSEPLLSLALQQIGAGVQGKPLQKQTSFQTLKIGEDGMYLPNYQRMYFKTDTKF
ncbi:MAG: peptidase S41 [Bacteroidetes bacterium]|jgi:C-terminal processing protease CtpA/Prc|nr:peptidase S41 [Bacteroidota bacterium]